MKNENNDFKFFCSKCAYGCDKKSLYNQHCKTKKHIMLKNAQKICINEKYDCSCGKVYKHIQSFKRHKSKCNFVEDDSIGELKKQVNTLVTQNEEMTKLLKDLIPNMNRTTIHNEYNIKMILNTDYKDAINLSEFIKSLQFDTQDLNHTIENGYANGITNIFIKGLQDLEIKQRPIHCTHLNNELFYVKENNIWDIEDSSKPNLKKAIATLSNKQINAAKNLKKTDTIREKEDYCKLVKEITHLDTISSNKIMKTLAKEVLIDNV